MSNLTEFEVTCYCCGKHFFVKENEKTFPSKEKYFCSKHCANKRVFSEEVKSRIGEKHRKPKQYFDVICTNCGKHFLVEEFIHKFPSKEKYFCSRSCANTRKQTKNIREKISAGLSKFHETQNKNKNAKKQKQYICGTEELDNKYIEISKHRIKKWFNKLIPFGFNIETIGTPEIITEFFKCKNIVYKEYVINKLSPADIYKKYNCAKYINHTETILHLIKEFNFIHRNVSESIKNAVLQGKCSNNFNYQYKQTWHTTWENKEVFLRSSYELDYALELDKNQIKYDVESLRIKYFDTERKEYRCAIPDFYLIDENTIVEIKSSWTYNKQNMQDKFNAYKKLGYKTKLILDHIEYTELI